MAKSYVYHSRDFIGLYYSNYKPYRTFIMIRNLKKKMSRWDIKKPNTKDETTNHHVLLMLRQPHEIIFNTSDVFTYPKICLNTRSICYGRHGNRTINCCGHRSAAYYYFYLWWHKKEIKDPHPKATKRFKNLINSDEWQRKFYNQAERDRLISIQTIRILYAAK